MALYKGTSIVDYLNSKGKDYSFNARKQLAAKSGITGYRGSEEQNIRLLNLLNKGDNVQQPINNRRANNEPIIKPFKLDTGKMNIASRESSQVIKNVRQIQPIVDRRNLTNGVIIDKRQNMSYVVKDGTIIKSDKILSGLNPNSNDASAPIEKSRDDSSLRVTPTGTYIGRPTSIYGSPGVKLQPVAAFGSPAPLVNNKKAISLHTVYDAANRDPLFNKSASQRYASYGCINYKPDAIKSLTSNYSKGDTTIIVDSKNAFDANLVNRLKARPTAMVSSKKPSSKKA